MAIYKVLFEKRYTISNLLTMGFIFLGCSLIEGGGGGDWAGGGSQKDPLPKICFTYPTMMTLGTVLPYLKKIQKI